MKTDSLGNDFIVWDRGPGLKWAVRAADGTWTTPPTLLDPDMDAHSFSILHMDNLQYAFTAMCYLSGTDSFDQLRLYTYGYPPDGTGPQPRHSESRTISLRVYPNPFASFMRVQMPEANGGALEMVDLLGRAVWSKPVPVGTHMESINDGRLANLPSGTYFLVYRGIRPVVPIQITHIK